MSLFFPSSERLRSVTREGIHATSGVRIMNNKLRLAVLHAFSILCCTVGAPILLAQATGAMLSGTVTGPDRKVIRNAAITLTNLAQGTMRKTKTDVSGLHTLPNLTSDDYNLEIVTTDFQREVQSASILAESQNQYVSLFASDKRTSADSSMTQRL